jgi:hypothetical protein
MSALGQSLQIHSAPAPINVRYASDSGHSRHGSELTRSANSGNQAFARLKGLQLASVFDNGRQWFESRPEVLWASGDPYNSETLAKEVNKRGENLSNCSGSEK